MSSFMTEVLSTQQITDWLGNHFDWTRNAQTNSLEREFDFADFSSSMAFANKIALAADAASHHPDLLIRYGKIKVSLSTHSAGGITEKDILLAEVIEKLARS